MAEKDLFPQLYRDPEVDLQFAVPGFQEVCSGRDVETDPVVHPVTQSDGRADEGIGTADG